MIDSDARLRAVLRTSHIAAGAVEESGGLAPLLEAAASVFEASLAAIDEYPRDGLPRRIALWQARGAAPPEHGRQHVGLPASGNTETAARISNDPVPTLYAPIASPGGLPMLLSVVRPSQPFSDGDLCLLVAIGSSFGAAMAGIAVAHREAAVRTRLEALHSIGQAFSSYADYAEVFAAFAAATKRLLEHDRLSAHVLIEGGLIDEAFATGGDSHVAAYPAGERRPVQASLPARVALEDQPFLSDDLPSDLRIASNSALVVPRNARSWLSVPLRADGRAFGALNFSTRAPATYTTADIAIAQETADQLAAYLVRANLHRRERDLAVAEERARLAREIHDTLAQDLSLLVLQLQAMESARGLPAATRREVHQAASQARLALEEARRSVWDLAPSPLDGRDLAAALEAELDGLCESAGVRGRLTVAGARIPLQPAIEAGVFRIAQEALANARKHAQARRVALELQYEADGITIAVEDNGRGFDTGMQPAAGASSGFGLLSMSERARLLGGVLEVTSSLGRGTRVAARLPQNPPRSMRPAPIPPHASRRATPLQNPDPEAIRVLIADDHAVARHGIRLMLDGYRDLTVVGEAADGQEAIELVDATRPDVILLDLQMPRLGGMEALGRMRVLLPRMGIIILTTFAQDERIFAALSEGARGYLLKDTSPDELAEAIRIVSGGGSLVQDVVAGKLLGHLQQKDPLTERELTVLRLVDEGLRSKEIAMRLSVSTRTVAFHLNNAYRKLNVSSRTEALRIARLRGLLPG